MKITGKKIQFTYIGNPPKDVNFKNTKIIKPLYGKKLAKQLSECHAYITGSLNEPAECTISRPLVAVYL